MNRTEDIKIVRKKIPWRRLGNEGVLVNREGKKLLVLNEIGTYIWECLDNPHTFDELVKKVYEEYDVDLDTARRDVGEFLENLQKLKLIQEEGALS